MATSDVLDVSTLREKFPALKQPQVFFDNAGGSQILGDVVDSIKDYLVTNNVQLGATYKSSEQSTDAYYGGLKACAEYINAAPDEIVLGPSTTQHFRNLSVALIPHLAGRQPPAELVISTIDHEANIASWVYLSKTLNLPIKWWTPTDSATNPHLDHTSLAPLLNLNTALVTCTHTSNILGSITDIAAISTMVHSVNPTALLCVDGVAFAPHRPLDVKALGVDFYSFSWYKVYGPHVAQLYASREAQDRALTSLGHYFKEGWTLEDKLGLAAASYEAVQSLPRIHSYLKTIGWDAMIARETVLQEILLSYLRGKPEKYTILGEPSSDAGLRVPVISFAVKDRNSKEIVETLERESDFGFRWGNFYSVRLIEHVLKLDKDMGVVRVSLLHYNTVEEVKAFVEALDKMICG